MSKLPSAKISPRIENGIIYWYEGNTFEITVTLDIVDQDGEAVTIASTDTVTVAFKNSANVAVKTFTLTGITDNTVTLDFDSTCTALFPAGKYTYDMDYEGDRKITIARGNEAVVE